MSECKEYGKITEVEFGICGYQDCQMGIHITLEGKGWGCGDTKAFWDYNNIKCDEYSKWTEQDRMKWADDTLRYVSNLLYKAKVNSISELKNMPVEVIFENNTLKSWRIFEEVL